MGPLAALLLTSPVAVALDLPVTRTTIDEHVAELAPLVEEIAGRRFANPPHAEIARSDELRVALLKEVEAHLSQILPDLPRSAVRAIAGSQAESMTEGLLGKYVLADRTVYVHPRAIVWAVRDAELPFEHLSGVGRLVLAHELAHALQDEVAGMSARVGEVRSLDALHALTAVVEGHAWAVQDAVAERLGLQAEAATLATLQGVGDPNSAGAFFYGEGRAFVEAAGGSPEQAWAVLLEPPTTTHEVMIPGDWRSPPARPDMPGASWAAVAKALGADDWAVVHVDQGAFDLRAMLRRGGLVASGEGLRGGHSWTAAEDEGVVRLRVYAFASEAAASATYAAWTKAAPAPVAGATSPYAAQVIEVGALPGLEATHARVARGSMPSGGKAPFTEQIWAMRGDCLVIVEIEEMEVGDEALARAIQGALDAVSAGEILPPTPPPIGG